MNQNTIDELFDEFFCTNSDPNRTLESDNEMISPDRDSFSLTSNTESYESEHVEYVYDEDDIELEPYIQFEYDGLKTPKAAKTLPLPEHKRPGPKPRVSDKNLSQVELIRKNRRRERNRAAAQRQRNKRNVQIQQYEVKIATLECERDEFKNKYEEMKEMYEMMKFRFASQMKRPHLPAKRQLSKRSAVQQIKLELLEPKLIDSQHQEKRQRLAKQDDEANFTQINCVQNIFSFL